MGITWKSSYSEDSLYIITDFQCHYKIGVTKGCVRKRLASLQTGNPNRIDVVCYYPMFGMAHYCEEYILREFYLFKTDGGSEWLSLSEFEIAELERKIRDWFLKRQGHATHRVTPNWKGLYAS